MRACCIAIALCLASLFAFAPPAAADDESSEHTAQLFGNDADTLGVYMKFDTKTGWHMTFRPKPGAVPLEIPLAFLPADHAHYAVVVGPRRHWLTFITQSRSDIDLKATAVWTMNAKGKVVETWPFGDFMNARELKNVRRSISHTHWLESVPIVGGNLIELRLATHRMIISPLTLKLRRLPPR